MSNRLRRPHRGGLAAVVGVVMALVACGGPDDSATVATEAAPAVVDATTGQSPTTTAAANAPTDAPTTTQAPTTVTLPSIEPLPTPALIPLEDDTPEPVVPLGSIAIPAIGIDRPMFEGIHLPTFDLGPGHWPGSALPGQVGNVVVGGHRTESHADFGDLDRLQIGDVVTFTDTGGLQTSYTVTAVEILDPFTAAIVHQTYEKTATLFACHPKGSTDHRIVVRLAIQG